MNISVELSNGNVNIYTDNLSLVNITDNDLDDGQIKDVVSTFIHDAKSKRIEIVEYSFMQIKRCFFQIDGNQINTFPYVQSYDLLNTIVHRIGNKKIVGKLLLRSLHP